MLAYGTITISDEMRGSGIYKITTAPSSYTTTTGGFTPTYRIALSTVKSQAGVTEVLIGDILEYSYYHYPVGYVDGSYVYLGPRVSFRGATGASATAYSLIVSHAAIVKAEDGTFTPDEITLTAKSQTGTAAMANYTGRLVVETTTDNSTWTNRYNQDAATYTYTIPSGIVAVRCSLYVAGGTATLLDQQVVPVVSDGASGGKGEDAYTVILTNENHTFAGGTSAALAGSTTCNVVAYKGATQVAATIGTISGAPTGMSTTITSNGTTSAYFTVTVTTSMVTKNGVLTVPVTVDGKSFSMKFSYSLALAGVSVTNVTSTNNTQDGGTSVVTVTLSDGSTKTFNVKNGNKGSTGATAQWFYGTALTHTSGTATASVTGAVVGSMYLNTTTSLVYKCTAISGSTMTWTYAGDLTTGVINNIEVGGRNLLINSGIATTSKEYANRDLYLTDEGKTLAANETVTFTMKARIPTEKTRWGIFNSGGSVTISGWKTISPDGETDVIYTWTGPWKIGSLSSQTYIRIYLGTSSAKTQDAIIYWAKLERGNIATDWTPAPEDVESAISEVQTTADTALTSANGKNKVYHQASQPSGGTYVTGDTWFDTNDGYKMYTYNGSSWVAETFGTNAISDLAITNAKIADATIQNAKIATVDAGKITTGTLDADRIAANSIVIGKLDTSTQNTISNASTNSELALSRSTEYIIGTQTAATGSWTGVTTDTELVAGKTIAYKLPYAGSGNASLNLTLAGGGTTGAKAVYLNTTRVTTHFGANAVINMTYDGTYWRASSIPNSNNYDRRLHNNAVLAATAITAAHLIGGTASGYKNLAASVAFDLSYPILYASAAINAAAAASNTYEAFPSVNFSTSGTIQGATANKVVYLKGSISGNTFTCASSNYLTCTVPTSADSMYYIPLGVLANGSTTTGYFSSSNRLYAYLNGAFQAVDTAAKDLANDAAKTATNYITYIDSTNGIRVYDGQTANQNVNYVQLNSSGMQVYKSNNRVASFGENAVIGKDDSTRVEISSDDTTFYGADNTTVGQIANGASADELHTFEIYYEDNFSSDISGKVINLTDTGNKDLGTASTFTIHVIVGNNYTAENDEEFEFTVTRNKSSSMTVNSDYCPMTIAYTYAASGSSFKITIGTVPDYTDLSYIYVEGYMTRSVAASNYSFGKNITNTGRFSFAEGYGTTASDTAAHAEGWMTRATKTSAHSEGSNTIASGSSSHAEGYKNVASGGASHAEGTGTKALIQCAHAEGFNTVANADSAHAEGHSTLADGLYSHAQNVGTMALNYAETALGQYNANTKLGVHNPGTYAIYLGNGTDTKRNNALLVDWKGDVYLALDEYEDDGTKDSDLAWGMDALGWMTNDIAPSIFNNAPMLDLKKLLINLVEHYPRFLSAKPTFTVNSTNVSSITKSIAVADGMVVFSFRFVNKIQFAANKSYIIGTITPKPAFNSVIFSRCGNVFNIQGWVGASDGGVYIQAPSVIASNKTFECMVMYSPTLS